MSWTPRSPHAFDGTLMLEVALAADLAVDLMPRQIMTSPQQPLDGGAVVQGVPADSTLSGATYAQDKRVVRALLQRADVPVVAGATFSFRGTRSALRYARRIRYPVTVRMAMGDQLQNSETVVRNGRGLRRTLRELRLVPTDGTASATNNIRSAYSLTGLLEHRIDDLGRELWSPATRFVIERHRRRTQTTTVLVIGARASAAVTTTPEGLVDVSESLDPELEQLALRSVRALAGLSTARVEIVTSPPSFRRRSPTHRVRDVRERPGLATFDEVTPGRSRDLAKQLLFGDDTASLDFDRTRRLDVQLDGVTSPEGVLACLPTATEVTAREDIEGHLRVTTEGRPAELADGLSWCVLGRDDGSRAMSIEVRPAM